MFREGWMPWLSTMGTTAAAVLVATGLIWVLGARPFLLVSLPIALIAMSVGVWLFYVQHQFERTYWAGAGDWDFHDAALYGSSHYDLPAVLRWFTVNIGLHQIHHLSSRIPSYRLPAVARNHPQLASIGRITFGESICCAARALWDERQRSLVTFRQAKGAGRRMKA